jgi:hypothetical protein
MAQTGTGKKKIKLSTVPRAVTIQQSVFYPQSISIGFIRVLEQTSIIFLNSISQLIFVIYMRRVLFKVGS